MARHIIHCGFHTALKSSWINEVPDLDTKVPLVYRIGQERAMGDAFSLAKRKHEWMQILVICWTVIALGFILISFRGFKND